MKKIIASLLALSFSLSAHAQTWVNANSHSKKVSDFLVAEVAAEGRHEIKIKTIQKDNLAKYPSYRAYAVVENVYHDDEENTTQKSITCDIIYVAEENNHFLITSWSKNQCDIEDIILLKQ